MPWVDEANPACHVGIWGRTGSGKTTLARKLVAARRRLVAFDPMAEYNGVIVTDELAMREAIAAGWRDGFRVSIVPAAGAEWRALLHRVSRELVAIQEPYRAGADDRPLTLLVDELAGAYPNERPPADRDGFGDLCRRGRHWGVQLVGASQRLADVSTVFRSACRLDIYLSQEDHSDLDAAVRRLGREHLERLRAMPPFRGLVRQSGGAVSEIVVAP